MSASDDVKDPLTAFAAEIRMALTIRRTEERLLKLFGEGKLFGTVHTGIGQEFVGVAVSRHLDDRDAVFSNHRCHGHFLAYGGDLTGLIAEIMGRRRGVCGGRGGSQHLHERSFFSNGILGGTVPVTAGLAMARRLADDGGIAAVYVGDGALGEGVVYETFNLASKWDLPLLIVCENNDIAQSTPQKQTLAGSITARARAFGIKARTASTEDWEDLFEQTEAVIAAIRTHRRPQFLEVRTGRLMAHSKGDDTRPADEVDELNRRDPLNRLIDRYADDPRWHSMEREIDERIDRAVEQAEASEFAGPLETDGSAAAAGSEETRWTKLRFPRERIVASVRRGLERSMTADDRVLLIGEDIESPYGGAFKCTAGLSDQFPGRVRNTPISEATLLGVGNGLALAGHRPVVEIMFGDFLTLTADQWINHAAKFAWMYNDQVEMPVVMRTPMGGKRGYAATHSQSLEKHFLGLPGTRVLCLHHRMSPADLYQTLLATNDRPTLVVENKILYGQYADSDPPDGYALFRSEESYPTVRMTADADPDLTIVAVGGLSMDAEAAASELFEEEEIVADLFLPTQLYPFDVSIIESSLRASRRLLVVEEGQGFVSWGAEVVAQATERFGSIGLGVRRLASAEVPIPAARPFEERCLVNREMIVDAASQMIREHLVH